MAPAAGSTSLTVVCVFVTLARLTSTATRAAGLLTGREEARLDVAIAAATRPMLSWSRSSRSGDEAAAVVGHSHPIKRKAATDQTTYPSINQLHVPHRQEREFAPTAVFERWAAA